MKREVRFTATAARELDRLPGEVKDRVLAAAAVLADEPLRGKPLKGELPTGLRTAVTLPLVLGLVYLGLIFLDHALTP